MRLGKIDNETLGKIDNETLGNIDNETLGRGELGLRQSGERRLEE